jgi:hypothetical protein
VNSSQFTSRYTSALADHLRDRNERSLRAAYELGREAVTVDVTILDVAAAHHEVLIQAVDVAEHAEIAGVIAASGDFLLETLAAYEMIQRGLPEVQNAVEAGRRKGHLLRRLSTFLSDESLALGDEAAIQELLKLVAEHTLEIVDARSCSIAINGPLLGRPITAGAVDPSAGEVALHDAGPTTDVSKLRTPLVALDGSTLGWIEISSGPAAFEDPAEGVLTQVAQMTAAAVDRALAYR